MKTKLYQIGKETTSIRLHGEAKNEPVTFPEAVERVAAWNGEPVEKELARNPRLVSANVLEDDECIYLVPKEYGIVEPYDIEKCRLDETDWIEHLAGKGSVDEAMLDAVNKIQNEYLANA